MIYTQTFDVENRLVEVINSGSNTKTTFAYDANGQRIMTIVEPVAPPIPGSQRTITYYPFPNYEKEVHATWQYTVKGWAWIATATIYRSTYLAEGQLVAIRVSGDPVNSGLFYYHGDHLNSATFLTKTDGQVKNGTTRFYTPFGETRLGGGNGITDRGFTSHFHADSLELVYMQARWYLAELGRFISADTIIPQPANPQSHNRYSYTVNRPLVFVDPSGHNYCTDPDIPCEPDEETPPLPDRPDRVDYFRENEPEGPLGGPGYGSSESQNTIGNFIDIILGLGLEEAQEVAFDRIMQALLGGNLSYADILDAIALLLIIYGGIMPEAGVYITTDPVRDNQHLMIIFNDDYSVSLYLASTSEPPTEHRSNRLTFSGFVATQELRTFRSLNVTDKVKDRWPPSLLRVMLRLLQEHIPQ